MASEQRWTYGPWRISGKGTIRAGTDWIGDVNWRNREANARLISAAPDLAEAARMAIESKSAASAGIGISRAAFDALVVAYAKARGE